MGFFRKLTVLFLLTASVFALFSCKNSSNAIAVIQYGTSDALDDCYKGFCTEFENTPEMKKGLNFEYYNAEFDKSKVASKAAEFVKKGVRCIVAIGEGAAFEANEKARGSDVPVIWAGLASEKMLSENPNQSGIAIGDKLYDDLQVIRDFFSRIPSVGVGVISTNTSLNSIKQIEELKNYGNQLKAIIITGVVSSPKDVAKKAEEMIKAPESNISCFLIINDDQVMSVSKELIDTCKGFNFPVFGNTEKHIEQGALAAYTVDYSNIGKNAAKKVMDVLVGAYIMNLPNYGPGNMFSVYSPESAEYFYKHTYFVTEPKNIEDYNTLRNTKPVEELE